MNIINNDALSPKTISEVIQHSLIIWLPFEGRMQSILDSVKVRRYNGEKEMRKNI